MQCITPVNLRLFILNPFPKCSFCMVNIHSLSLQINIQDTYSFWDEKRENSKTFFHTLPNEYVIEICVENLDYLNFTFFGRNLKKLFKSKIIAMINDNELNESR